MKTIKDYFAAECALDDMTCLNCGESGEVILNQKLADGYCQVCGTWQEELIS